MWTTWPESLRESRMNPGPFCIASAKRWPLKTVTPRIGRFAVRCHFLHLSITLNIRVCVCDGDLFSADRPSVHRGGSAGGRLRRTRAATRRRLHRQTTDRRALCRRRRLPRPRHDPPPCRPRCHQRVQLLTATAVRRRRRRRRRHGWR